MKLLRAATCVLACLLFTNAHAHSASDAYVTLTSAPQDGASADTVIHGQWDIALRDLDFVLAIDGDGDGRITWRELKRQLPAIAKYAYPTLTFAAGGATCRLRPGKSLVTDHADGAYVALFFDVVCPRAGTTPPRVTLDYRLFFAIDPSHRGIVVWRTGDDVATAVLSPDNATIGVGRQTR